ncbi:hypothetical protein BDV29DRAFT_176819 [Aspergillus leporis]|uniref:HNH nuclease domain-containing protein n=1 Tax=Aspergillus leporis TaxID=41062 RepID=A0A5N5X083_9EURO|nr:hypothetical protein BDV29DRAFT_176819 [Aspergillus leporis]
MAQPGKHHFTPPFSLHLVDHPRFVFPTVHHLIGWFSIISDTSTQSVMEIDQEGPSCRRGHSGTIIAEPAADIERFNVPSPERIRLIEQLGEVLGQKLVPPAFWAALQVCQLSCIESMVQVARENPFFVSFFADHCNFIPLLWKQATTQATASSATSSTTDEWPSPAKIARRGRAKNPKYKARERDKNMCALTKRVPIDVAHIYPHCLISSPDDQRIPNFWNALRGFWPPEQIQAWERKIFQDPTSPTKASDSCSNQICLNKQIHALWGDGRIVFRPLDYHDDMKKLDIELYWQPGQGHKFNDRIPITKLPVSSEGVEKVTRSDGAIYTEIIVDGKYIRSGHVFTLETPNPETHPLPSKELLMMQWNLTRVLALSGAADADELNGDDYDDDVGGSQPGPRQVSDWLACQQIPSSPASSSSTGDDADTSFITSADPSPAKTRAGTAENNPMFYTPTE